MTSLHRNIHPYIFLSVFRLNPQILLIPSATNLSETVLHQTGIEHGAVIWMDKTALPQTTMR